MSKARESADRKCKQATYVCNINRIANFVISIAIRTTIDWAFIERHHILHKNRIILLLTCAACLRDLKLSPDFECLTTRCRLILRSSKLRLTCRVFMLAQSPNSITPTFTETSTSESRRLSWFVSATFSAGKFWWKSQNRCNGIWALTCVLLVACNLKCQC